MTAQDMDRVAAVTQLWDQVIAVADTIAPQQWEDPVPWCPGWRVADLVSHLGGLQTAMNGAPQPDPPAGWEPPTEGSLFDIAMAPSTAARQDWTPAQRLEELHIARDGHAAALRSVEDWSAPAQGPVGPTTQDGLFRVRAFDIWVHLQDLRNALGVSVEFDDRSDAATAAFDYVVGLLPWMFVKRAGATDGDALLVSLSAPLDRSGIVRVVERRAHWEDATEAVDDRLTAAPGALTLLASGRGAPEHWRDEGGVQWSGSLATAFVERARLF